MKVPVWVEGAEPDQKSEEQSEEARQVQMFRQHREKEDAHFTYARLAVPQGLLPSVAKMPPCENWVAQGLSTLDIHCGDGGEA